MRYPALPQSNQGAQVRCEFDSATGFFAAVAEDAALDQIQLFRGRHFRPTVST